MMHIFRGNLTIIGSDNGLSPDRRGAISRIKYWNIVNWTLKAKFQWYFNHNSCISFKKMQLKRLRKSGHFVSAQSVKSLDVFTAVILS